MVGDNVASVSAAEASLTDERNFEACLCYVFLDE
jgi:hypothetical protein